MHYLVYITTNKINGKRYIGAHRTPDIDDGYMGSGTLITKAFKKYGPGNFTREILESCSSPDEMFATEIKLIAEMKPEYNITPGGEGGFGKVHSQESKKKISDAQLGKRRGSYRKKIGSARRTFSDETRKKMSDAWIRRRLIPVSEETRKKLSARGIDRYATNNHHMLGKSLTNETKNKMSAAAVRRWRGTKRII